VKLVLGAAQFGSPYGVTRQADHVCDGALRGIFADAAALGVFMVDTSPAYGDSEARLGAARLDPVLELQTKTRGGTIDLALDDARADFEQSKRRLGRDSFDSFLIHSVGQLFTQGGGALLRFLLDLKDKGHARRIGVSVYDAAQIDRVLEMFTPDVVQVPLSVADQRLVENGALRRLKDNDVCVQARSVFLQGVLLSEPGALSDSVRFLAPHLARFRADAPQASARCFGFLESTGMVDEVVVGVHSLSQLREIAAAMKAPERGAPWSRFKFPNELVDPRVWPQVSKDLVS
jgi:aryl-alcohol dehydrogenase-like predicted oxidoreductase